MQSENQAQTPEQQSPLAVAQDLSDERTTLQKIFDAVHQDRVFVVYQPIVNAKNFRKILSFEALVRIADEYGRVIPAGEFIDVIENDEVGRIIDTEVMRICLRKMKLNPTVRLSLNVSARSIGHLPWRTTLHDAMNRDQTLGSRITLEFTEVSVNTVPEFVTAFMRDLQATGMTFALDNFGAGQTSLHTFKKFMFDFVKFDTLLTRETITCADTEVLVRALIEFSHHFDMGVVIDRIENEQSLRFFQDLNADFFQGYLFGKPKP